MNRFKTLSQMIDNQKYTIIGKLNQSDKQFLTSNIDLNKKILLIMNIKDRNKHQPLYLMNYFQRVYKHKKNISFDDACYILNRMNTQNQKNSLQKSRGSMNTEVQNPKTLRKSNVMKKFKQRMSENSAYNIQKKKLQKMKNQNAFQIRRKSLQNVNVYDKQWRLNHSYTQII